MQEYIIIVAIGDIFEYEEDKMDNGEYAAISADAHRDDANGSAKLVLVSIRRSIAAWLKILINIG